MKNIIGVIGPLAAGKDSVAEYAAGLLKIPVYQISSELRALAQERGISSDRESLIQLSRDIADKGDDYLARRILEKCTDSQALITGMRQLGQIEYLRKNSSFILIGINASPEIRFERVKRRNKPGDPLTLEDFVKVEGKEDGDSVQKVSDCMKQADYLIINESIEEDMYSAMENILKREKLI